MTRGALAGSEASLSANARAHPVHPPAILGSSGAVTGIGIDNLRVARWGTPHHRPCSSLHPWM